MISTKHAVLIAAAAALAPPWPCAAKPRVCQLGYKRALKLERTGKLIEAQAELQACAKSACGSVVQRQCTVRYERLLADTPSIVPTVSDAEGAPVVDVEVTMDGDPLATRIDGRALSIDPGLHEFVFLKNKEVVATQKLVILQGQRNHPVSVKLERPKEPPPVTVARAPAPAPAPEAHVPPAALAEVPPPEPKRRSLAGPYTVLGTGLLALGGYGVLTYWGRKDNDKLAQCTPNCLQASVAHVRDLYLYANVSLSVGIVSVVTGGAWLFRNWGVSVQPSPQGAYASIGGLF
jgi:hypothetical protein